MSQLKLATTFSHSIGGNVSNHHCISSIDVLFANAMGSSLLSRACLSPLESPGALFHSLSSLHPMHANCVNSRGTKPQEEEYWGSYVDCTHHGALMLTVHICASVFFFPWLIVFEESGNSGCSRPFLVCDQLQWVPVQAIVTFLFLWGFLGQIQKRWKSTQHEFGFHQPYFERLLTD